MQNRIQPYQNNSPRFCDLDCQALNLHPSREGSWLYAKCERYSSSLNGHEVGKIYRCEQCLRAMLTK